MSNLQSFAQRKKKQTATSSLKNISFFLFFSHILSSACLRHGRKNCKRVDKNLVRIYFVYLTAIFCPVLTRVSNSQGWKCAASPGLSMYQHGTQCQTQCNDGYKPKSGTSAFRICSGDGQWSGQSLQCERELLKPSIVFLSSNFS